MKFVFIFLAQCLLYHSMSFPSENPPKKQSRIKIPPAIFEWRNRPSLKLPKRHFRKTMHVGTGVPSNHSGLRPSVFPNVPPYYKFVLYNESVQWPPPVRKYLTWRKDSVNSNILRNTIKSSGFTLDLTKWNYPWDKSVKRYITVNATHKLNQTPGSRQVDNKAKLWVNLKASIARHGTEVYDFVPKTFLLPDDMGVFKEAWDAKSCQRSKCLWILKPPHKANGSGVKVVTKWSQVPVGDKLVAQEYIPPLLVHQRKFDLRLYVLVTNFRPLRAYFFKDGLVRFAVTEYSNDTRKANRLTIHLTNRAINRKSKEYVKNDSTNDTTTSTEWSVQTLWRYLDNLGYDTTSTKARIEDLIIKTLISVEDSVMEFAYQVPSRYSSYQLYGFDVGIDENMKPWLFEVNISPGMGTSSEFLLDLKAKLVTEYFNIAGYHFPVSMSREAQNIVRTRLGLQDTMATVTYDPRLYRNGNSIETKRKQRKYTDTKLITKNADEILTNLTPDDLRQLITEEDELTQCDGFYRIFPSSRSHLYLKYFEKSHYHNLLLNAWEMRYGENRSAGLNILREACEAKLHLKI